MRTLQRGNWKSNFNVRSLGVACLAAAQGTDDYVVFLAECFNPTCSFPFGSPLLGVRVNHVTLRLL